MKFIILALLLGIALGGCTKPSDDATGQARDSATPATKGLMQTLDCQTTSAGTRKCVIKTVPQTSLPAESFRSNRLAEVLSQLSFENEAQAGEAVVSNLSCPSETTPCTYSCCGAGLSCSGGAKGFCQVSGCPAGMEKCSNNTCATIGHCSTGNPDCSLWGATWCTTTKSCVVPPVICPPNGDLPQPPPVTPTAVPTTIATATPIPEPSPVTVSCTYTCEHVSEAELDYYGWSLSCPQSNCTCGDPYENCSSGNEAKSFKLDCQCKPETPVTPPPSGTGSPTAMGPSSK